MSNVSVLAALSTAAGVFCLSCSGGTSDGSSSGSGPNGTGTGTGITAGLDGAWDITTAGRGQIGPSEMTISNGVVEGFIPSSTEGKDSLGCTKVKDRAEFKLTFAGNALSGTITEVRELEGGAECANRNKSTVTPVSGTRQNAGSGLSGEWEVTVGKAEPFIVVVDGLTAKAWDKKRKSDGNEASANATVAGDSATVTADDRDFTFAARRR